MKGIKRSILSLMLALALVVSGVSVMPVKALDNNSQTITNLKFVENSNGSCTITWDKLSGGSYNIYKAKSRYAKYSKVATVSDSAYTDTDYNGEYYKVSYVSGKEYELSNPISYEIQTFGLNTNIFEPTDSTSEIQSCINNIYKKTEAGQFISDRYALMFAPGNYSKDINVEVGFYTQVAGLGISPENTVIGNINCKAEWMKGKKYDGSVNYNALCNFWRSVENLTTTASSTMWAVSQATSMRRMNIKGSLDLHHQGGYASGGFLADTKVAGRKYTYTDQKTGKQLDGEAGISGGSQQQWISRNTEMNRWDGSVWNYVFVGCSVASLYDKTNISNGPNGEWPYLSYTKVSETPECQEKPFLMKNDDGKYGVYVPAVRKNSTGVSWANGNEGEFIDLDRFYVAKPSDSATKINDELKTGKNLILTPGIYNLSQAINITNENTIVLGLGYATLKPVNGNQCMTVSNVGGVKIAGVLFDAGAKKSSALLTVGTSGDKTSHKDNPILLSDTFYRVGGADSNPGKVTTCVVINSSDVIGDNFWVWRADHGAGVGWNKNTADTGVIINGDNVTTYGLMVEHFQKYQTIWNGNGGKCYMYQSELPYDITSQNVWNAKGSYGYTDYKVSSNVKTHEAYGIGIYSCYQAATCFLKSAVECPDTPGVKFTNVCTYSLSGNGGIDYAINKSGYGVYTSSEMCKIMSYSNGKAVCDKTGTKAKKSIWSTSINVATNSLTYTGKAIKRKVTVKYKGITLREGTDYTVTYKNNKDIGTSKIIINGIGNFRESDYVTFKIVPGKTKITKKKATKKKVNIQFAKVKGAKGYQVVYSTNKKFKGKTVKNIKKTKLTFKRKNNSTYYVKVRALKKVGRKTYYGSYCKTVKIK